MAKKYNEAQLAPSNIKDLMNVDIFGERKIKTKDGEYDDFFGISDKNKKGSVEMMETEKLRPSKRNPYDVEYNDEMKELIASIAEKGILVPLIVREMEGFYEIVAGHRRYFATTHLNLSQVPVVIMELTDDEADIIMVDSNLNRTVKISEKARAINMKYEAIKRTWGGDRKSDKNQRPPGDLCSEEDVGNQRPPGDRCSEEGENSAEIIAKQMGVGRTTIKSYIRLTHLDHKLLSLVDSSELPLKAGVELSYIPLKTQDYIYTVMSIERIKINHDFAKILRAAFENKDDVIMDEVVNFITEQRLVKPKSKAKVFIKISKDVKKEYFPKSFDDEKIEAVLKSLLDTWAKENNPDYPAYEENQTNSAERQ